MRRINSDREMLQSCLLAMQSSKRNGGVTDWTQFISELDQHLQLPERTTKTDFDRYQKMTNFTDKLSKIFLDGEGEWEELEVLGYNSFGVMFEKIENLVEVKDITSEMINKLETKLHGL